MRCMPCFAWQNVRWGSLQDMTLFTQEHVSCFSKLSCCIQKPLKAQLSHTTACNSYPRRDNAFSSARNNNLEILRHNVSDIIFPTTGLTSKSNSKLGPVVIAGLGNMIFLAISAMLSWGQIWYSKRFCRIPSIYNSLFLVFHICGLWQHLAM